MAMGSSKNFWNLRNKYPEFPIHFYNSRSWC